MRDSPSWSPCRCCSSAGCGRFRPSSGGRPGAAGPGTSSSRTCCCFSSTSSTSATTPTPRAGSTFRSCSSSTTPTPPRGWSGRATRWCASAARSRPRRLGRLPHRAPAPRARRHWECGELRRGCVASPRRSSSPSLAAGGGLRQVLLVPAALVRRPLLDQHLRRRPRAQPGALLRRDPAQEPAAYDLAKVRAAYPVVANFLGIADADPARLIFARRAAPWRRRAAPGDGAPPRRPNVVIVLLESFAAYKTGAFGNPLDPTPRFDALAREGTLYTRFFTPTWGTARSVWATVTGLPDVEPHLTATRNPLHRLAAHDPQRLHRLREALLPRRQPELGEHPRAAHRERRGAAHLRGGELRRAARRCLGDLGPRPLRGSEPRLLAAAAALRRDRPDLREPPPLHDPGEPRRLHRPPRRGRGGAPQRLRLGRRVQRLPLPRPRARRLRRRARAARAGSPTPSSSSTATTGCRRARRTSPPGTPPPD